MELCAEVIEGLQIAGDSSRISDSCFQALLENSCQSLRSLVKRANSISANMTGDQAMVKAAHASLLALLLEAAKHDYDASGLVHILEDNRFSVNRISECTKAYEQAKPHLRGVLANIGTNVPHIVDVDWRLDYYIKNNHLDKVSLPVYLVNLKTQTCGQSLPEDIQLSCTQDQLQDLVTKLKDACKSVERASQP